MFDFWAMDHQRPPPGDWRTWVILGGRGAGKTRAGAEWVRAQVEGPRAHDRGRCRRVALVGETYDQARAVMVQGDSGLLACAAPDRRPQWIATRRMLEWPNGAQAYVFSAQDPEALRGPQFDAAWCDELAKWPQADTAWNMLQFGLRLGDDPQQLVTTTPRNQRLLKDILARSNTVSTHAPTEANRANLAASFLQDVREMYGNTALGRQELDGVLLDDVEGALWTHDRFKRVGHLGPYDRVIVAVDPPVSHTATSDECGIVVVGITMADDPAAWTATVMADRSFHPNSPNHWADRVVRTAYDYNATAVVAEVNQGGDLVTTVLATHDAYLPVVKVHATQSKQARAEPIAALYEQGRVYHYGDLGALEDQLCLFSAQGYQGAGSPDRADALVWALKHGMIDALRATKRPQLRSL